MSVALPRGRRACERARRLTLLLSPVCPQCGCREGPSHPLRLRQLLRLGEELPAHAGGAGLQPGDVRLPLRQAELQPELPQLAALRWAPQPGYRSQTALT